MVVLIVVLLEWVLLIKMVLKVKGGMYVLV